MKLLHYVESNGDREYVVLTDDESPNRKRWIEPGYELASISDVDPGPRHRPLPLDTILRRDP